MSNETLINATDATRVAPDWWKTGVRAPFSAGESFAALLHGNTDDFVWLGWSLQRWVAQQFAGTPKKPGQEVVVMYSPARGLTFQTAEQKKLFDRTFGWPPPMPPEMAADRDLAAANQAPEDMPLPDEADKCLTLALEFLRLARREDPDDKDSLPVINRRKLADGTVRSGLDACGCSAPMRDHTVAYHDGARSAALIIDHVELLVGSSSPHVDPITTHCLEMLHDAATEVGLINAWNPICMISRTLSNVAEYVRTAPGLKTVRVPLPDHAGRLDTIRRLLARESDIELVDLDAETLAAVTAGLGRRDLEDIVLRADDRDGKPKLTRAIALQRQQELMDVKSGGVVVRLETNVSFDDLGGMSEAKEVIENEMVAPIAAGHPDEALRGMALIGPPGTGKSALAMAAGKRAGINAVEIRAGALKSKWHGESEGKVETMIEVVTMYAPTFCYMDEFDKLFGSSDSASQENAPDQAMRGRIQQWMATAEGIIFMVATNYPDRVDPALFRTGRIDKKAPILAPETPAERADILARILHRYNVDRSGVLEEQLVKVCTDYTSGWVGSDLELAVKDAVGTMKRRGVSLIDALTEAVENIIPADNPDIRNQTRNAIVYCNDLRLLPPKIRERRKAELRQQRARDAVEGPTAPLVAAEVEPVSRRRRPEL